jgi:Ca-activated chloride channel family protein
MRPILFITLLLLSFMAHSQEAEIDKGNQYYQAAQYDLAEAQYRKAMELDPKNTTAQYNLANALQKQNKFDEASKVLETLANTTPNKAIQSAAWYNHGVALTKLKNLEGSIESYKKALRINPSDQEARENLEKALLELKKKQSQSSQNKSSSSSMSQKEAEQKLQLLQQKEKEIQQRKNKGKQQGAGQAQDW